MKITLKFNPKKYISIHYSNKPLLDEGKQYSTLMEPKFLASVTGAKFLGKPIVAFLRKDTVTVEQLNQRRPKLMKSKLVPLKRLDCLKTIFYLFYS